MRNWLKSKVIWETEIIELELPTYIPESELKM